MDAVQVTRLKLIKIIEKNREKHIAAYVKAEAGWRIKLEEDLVKLSKMALKAADVVGHGADVYKIKFPNLPKPQSYVTQYDRVIGMLKMSVDENVALDAESYDQYVQDQWAWSNAFTNSTVQYAVGAAKMLRLKKRK